MICTCKFISDSAITYVVKLKHDKLNANYLTEEGVPLMGNILGQRIRHLRQSHQLSQMELATELNITNVQLSRYESGSRKPDPETIAFVASYFHVTADYLLGLSSSIRENDSEYISHQQDIDLLNAIHSYPELESLIKEMITNHNQFLKLKKIWSIMNGKENSG